MQNIVICPKCKAALWKHDDKIAHLKWHENEEAKLASLKRTLNKKAEVVTQEVTDEQS